MTSTPPTSPSAEMAAYFQRELQDFAESGKALVHKHPVLARHLGRQAQNPDVERLLEGTAFLCAQIRARIDACAPQVVQELGQRTAPWLLRDMPSATILGVHVPLSWGERSVHLPQGTEFKETDGDRQLVYRTTCPTTLLPVQVTHMSIEDQGQNLACLTLAITTSGQLTFGTLKQAGLTLFVGGPHPDACALAFSLQHGSHKAQLYNGSTFCALPAWVQPPSHIDAEPLTPTFAHEPPLPAGIAALRDQALLPHKRAFVTLRFDDVPEDLAVHEHITLSILIDKRFAPPAAVNQLSMHANAVPAVNLTLVDAMPLRVSAGQSRYVLRADTAQRGACDVLAVHQAELLQPTHAAPKPIAPHHSYLWAPTHGQHDEPFYTFEPGRPGGHPAHIEVHSPQGVRPPLTPQILSTQVWAHDASVAHPLATQTLQLKANHPSFVRAKNLTPTTCVVPAPLPGHDRAALVDTIAQRAKAAYTCDDVRRLLRLTHAGSQAHSPKGRELQRMMDGILAVSTAVTLRLWQGAHVMCLDVTLTLDGACFDSLGAAYLLADAYAITCSDTLALHAVMRMCMHVPTWGHTTTWPLRAGPATFGRLTCTRADERR